MSRAPLSAFILSPRTIFKEKIIISLSFNNMILFNKNHFDCLIWSNGATCTIPELNLEVVFCEASPCLYVAGKLHDQNEYLDEMGSGGTEVPPGRQPTSWNFFVSLMSRHVRTLYSACRTGVLGSLPLAPVEFVLVAGSAPPLVGAAGSAPPPVDGPSLKTPCLLCTHDDSTTDLGHHKVEDKPWPQCWSS
mgnify:CR=1 FL=1